MDENFVFSYKSIILFCHKNTENKETKSKNESVLVFKQMSKRDTSDFWTIYVSLVCKAGRTQV